VLFLVFLWRLRYKLSLRDIAEMFLERGFEFTHAAVRDWKERFAHLFTDKLKAKRKSKSDLSKSWRLDETVRSYRDFNQSGTIKSPVPCG
jgi:putative transposase